MKLWTYLRENMDDKTKRLVKMKTMKITVI